MALGFTSKAEAKPGVGIFFSPEAIVLSEAVLEGGAVAVRNLIKVSVPGKAGETGATTRVGTLNTEFLADTGRLVELLKPAVEQGDWRGRQVIVTLSPHFGLARYFVMPAVDRRFWKQSVPLEAKKYIPFAFSELKYDFQVFPFFGAEKAKMGVLFGLAPVKNIDSIQTLMKALGLELMAVELAAFSSVRVWKGLPSGHPDGFAAAQVHFDPHSAYVVMHERGVPYITREVHWTGDQLDRRRIDLGGSIDFARKQLGVKDVRVFVSGSVELGPWVQGVKEDLNLAAEPLDLGAAGLKSTEFPAVACVGAALRPSGASPVLVDISQAYSKLFEDQRVHRVLTLAAGGLAGLLLLLSLFYQVRVLAAGRRLAELRQTTGNIPAFQGLEASMIDAIIQKLTKESKAFEPLFGKRPYVSKWLSTLPDAMPATVWLQRLDYNGPVDEPSRALRLVGFALGQDRNDDVRLAKDYIEVLKKDKTFLEVFPECVPSFEAAGGAEGADPERRTPFSITCEKKVLGKR